MSARWFSGLALRAGLRYYRDQPAQLLVTLLGLALGVAVVIATDLATGSAERAVEDSVRLLEPGVTHRLLPAGRALDEGYYAKLRRGAGLERAFPVIEGRLVVRGGDVARLPLVGTDAVALFDRGEAGGRTAAGVQAAFAQLLTTPGAVLATPGAAAALGAAPGDALLVEFPGSGQRLVLAGLLPAAAGGGGGDFLLADIATAQELLRRPGVLDRVDLVLDAAGIDAVTALLPPDGWQLVTLQETLAGFDGLSRAFRMNLQAFSLLALLLGAFLVYSTMLLTLLRRRALFATLRCLGMTRLQVAGLLLIEVMMFAAIAAAMGMVLGIVLGAGLVGLVLRTLDDLYFPLTVADYAVTWRGVLRGAALGLFASLAAAVLPVLEVLREAPRMLGQRTVIEAGARGLAARCGWLALVLLAAGAGLLAVADALEQALPAMFLLLGAAALAVPGLVYLLCLGLARVWAASGRLLPAWAARSLATRLSRTGPALAALVLALGSFVAVGLLIAGLRASVDSWLDYSLDADAYLLVDAGLPAGLSLPELRAQVEALPGAAGVSLSRRVPLPGAPGQAVLLAVEPGPPGLARWPQMRGGGGLPEAWRAGQDVVLVSEAWSRRHEQSTGDRLTLLTPDGPRQFRIEGLFVDYSSETGVVAMALDRYQALFDDDVVGAVGVFALPGESEELLAALESLADDFPPLRVADSRQLRAFSLAIFDRTFTVTRVLQLIAGIVAFMALLNALRALQMDAGRELAVLHALGLDRAGLRQLGRLQHLLLGLLAALLAVPLGLMLARLLTGTVTPIAFGWSTRFVLDARLMVEAMLLALGAALLAGWRAPLPAETRRLSRE
ncbi:MAG: ABC transporter permease [Chromatiales bacterium]|nr:ABC transporter permease [Chromatiales bacterium]